MPITAPRSEQTSPAYAGLLGTWLEGWTALSSGLTDCFAAALREAPRPLDVPRWMSLTARRGRPSWSSPHEIVFEAPLARLRDFSSTPARGLVPTLVLPPQAGHDSCIVDYAPDQSQMRAIVDAGLRRAYTLDWMGATPETADASRTILT